MARVQGSQRTIRRRKLVGVINHLDGAYLGRADLAHDGGSRRYKFSNSEPNFRKDHCKYSMECEPPGEPSAEKRLVGRLALQRV
jgi:hypothetical protein